MTWTPTRKVSGASIGLPLAVILVWALGEADIVVPANVAAAMGSLLSVLIAYLIPEPTT